MLFSNFLCLWKEYFCNQQYFYENSTGKGALFQSWQVFGFGFLKILYKNSPSLGGFILPVISLGTEGCAPPVPSTATEGSSALLGYSSQALNERVAQECRILRPSGSNAEQWQGISSRQRLKVPLSPASEKWFCSGWMHYSGFILPNQPGAVSLLFGMLYKTWQLVKSRWVYCVSPTYSQVWPKSSTRLLCSKSAPWEQLESTGQRITGPNILSPARYKFSASPRLTLLDFGLPKTWLPQLLWVRSFNLEALWESRGGVLRARSKRSRFGAV